MRTLITGLLFSLIVTTTVFTLETDSVSVEVLVKSTSSWDGILLPAYGTGQPEITILRIIIPPGERLPLHMHPVINAGILLRGKLTVTTEDNKVLHVNAGDTVVEVVNTWHFGANEGTEPVEIIVFYAGVEGEPVTIQKGM